MINTKSSFKLKKKKKKKIWNIFYLINNFSKMTTSYDEKKKVEKKSESFPAPF